MEKVEMNKDMKLSERKVLTQLHVFIHFYFFHFNFYLFINFGAFLKLKSEI